MYDYFYGQQSDLFTFYRVPKVLFTSERFWNISADAKMLYGILLDRMSLSARNGWIDESGRVYIIFTIDEAKSALNCAEADFEWAVTTATKKKKLDCSSAEFLTIDEGLCVQIMHAGPFDDEPATVALMDGYLEQNGYVNDFSEADCTMRFICLMQERLLPISGKPLLDIQSKGVTNFRSSGS